MEHARSEPKPGMEKVAEAPALPAVEPGRGSLFPAVFRTVRARLVFWILAVTVPIREQYFVEEHLREYDSLDKVLAAEAEFPLQQFFLIPWRWTYLAQHRREVAAPRSWHAPLYRAYWFATIDVGLHVLLVLLAQVLRAASLLRGFYRWLVLAFVVRGWRVVDRSDRRENRGLANN